MAREAFKATYRIPERLFESYLADFTAHYAALGRNPSRQDFRQYWANWARKRWQNEQIEASKNTTSETRTVHKRVFGA